MPLLTTSSSPGGASGASAVTFGGAVFMCAYMIANISPSNGLWPVSVSYSTQASA
jgi:hypothetical protein